MASPVDEKVDSRVDDDGEVEDKSQLIEKFCRPDSRGVKY